MLGADDIEALAAGAANSPAALFEAIHRVAQRRVDAGLVTAMRHDEAASTVERVYSSDPQAYPVGGRKLKRDTGWSRKVLVEHRILVNAGDDDIREVLRGLRDHLRAWPAFLRERAAGERGQMHRHAQCARRAAGLER